MKCNGEKDLLVGPIYHNKAVLTCAFILWRIVQTLVHQKVKLTVFLTVIRCNGNKLKKLAKLHSYNYILDWNCNQSSTTLCVTWPIIVYKSYKQILHMTLNCYLFNCDHFIIPFSTEVKGLFFLASEVVKMKGHHKAFCTTLFVPKCTKQIKQNHKANNSGKWSARHVFMVWSLVSRLHID